MSTEPVGRQIVRGPGGAESRLPEAHPVRAEDTLFHWCGTADAIRQSTDRVEKGALLEAYLSVVADDTLAPAARFFSGTIQPLRDGRTIRVGWSIVIDAMRELTHIDPAKLRVRYAHSGDLGDLAGEVFAGRLPSGVSVAALAAWAGTLASAPGANARRALVRDMLARLSSLEAQYLVKLLGGKLRIGLEESQIEEAIANAFAQPLALVQQATVSSGDLGEVALRARGGALETA